METNEKEYSKFQWFLFVVVIPSFFTLIVVFVLLSVTGFNPLGAMKDFATKIPVISSLFNNEENKAQNPKEDEVSVSDLEEEILAKETKVTQLENELETKSGEIQSLEEEIKNLSDELLQLQEERLSKSKSLKELTKMYELMSPKNAAKIIPNLKEDEATEILSSIDTEKLAAIFEKMSPEDAAKFTQLITK
ncbi:MotE family protein [Bacillus timonensis]|uniref:MotE family protein n=1 Tax=Bacillus timonensis TaxID=1033734 RepID=UPI000287ED81|nr:MgtE intracellular region [Bacillus timonensis]